MKLQTQPSPAQDLTKAIVIKIEVPIRTILLQKKLKPLKFCTKVQVPRNSLLQT